MHSALSFIDKIPCFLQAGSAGIAVIHDRPKPFAAPDGVNHLVGEIPVRIEFDPGMFQEQIEFRLDPPQGPDPLLDDRVIYSDQSDTEPKNDQQCNEYKF